MSPMLAGGFYTKVSNLVPKPRSPEGNHDQATSIQKFYSSQGYILRSTVYSSSASFISNTHSDVQRVEVTFEEDSGES
ncbi:hypothetical protein BDV34DRAFT_215651 [Aspergillus parasiticus]|uniref:Uncharacterized protein n=1 Tax=Aspergillus parasiticus TaxID=5067 RepID=A0A5N6DAF3_ASPPA|nr:hypothetical protein BDV34DRAFT_215651 [Aspergillus parasiticus]